VSESPIPEPDLREQIARIDRAQEETREFVSEQHRLHVEARKRRRDRRFLPWTVVAALPGAGAAPFAAGAGIVKLMDG
jgi:hypothetical protein